MEIADGVHTFTLDWEFEGEPTVYNLAFVTTENGAVLIDTGFPDHADEIEAALGEAGVAIEDLEFVIVTHQDDDHAAGARALRDRSGAAVVSHPRAAPYIAREEDLISYGDSPYPPVETDVEVVDGVTFRTEAGPLRVVETPGHTPGHISLYLPEPRLLVSGDALTSVEGLDGPMERPTLDMDRAVESVGTLAELDVERTLCYHGGLVDEGTARIREIYEERTD